MTDVAYQNSTSCEKDFCFSPTAQAHAYRNVDRMFATREADPPSTAVLPWNVAGFRPAIKPGKAAWR
jgi:hypothetical protein